jgi:hypothetical protein
MYGAGVENLTVMALFRSVFVLVQLLLQFALLAHSLVGGVASQPPLSHFLQHDHHSCARTGYPKDDNHGVTCLRVTSWTTRKQVLA